MEREREGKLKKKREERSPLLVCSSKAGEKVEATGEAGTPPWSPACVTATQVLNVPPQTLRRASAGSWSEELEQVANPGALLRMQAS